MTNRQATIAYLRHLADTPDGVKHRDWLFGAALMLGRDVSITWVDNRPKTEITEEKTQ